MHVQHAGGGGKATVHPTYTSDGGNRNTVTELKYDNAVNWVPQTSTYTSSSSSSNDAGNVPQSATGSEPSSKVDSKTEADKKYIETEFNVLTGELTVKPSKDTIRIKVNDTIRISGVGSNLSGKYFVSGVKKQ